MLYQITIETVIHKSDDVVSIIMDKMIVPATIFVIVLFIALVVSYICLEKRPKARRILGLIILGAFLTILLYETVFSRAYCGWRNLLKLEPFWSYKECFTFENGFLHIANRNLFRQILMNYLVFFPFGFLLVFTWPRIFISNGYSYGSIRVVVLSFFLSLAIEVLQISRSVGFFEIDDIVGNVLGSAISYACFVLILSLIQKHKNCR